MIEEPHSGIDARQEIRDLEICSLCGSIHDLPLPDTRGEVVACADSICEECLESEFGPLPHESGCSCNWCSWERREWERRNTKAPVLLDDDHPLLRLVK